MVGTYAMVVFKRGGSVNLFPINGVGFLWQYSQVWIPTNETGEKGFLDHKVTIGVLFIFLVYHWQDGFTGDSSDYMDNLELDADGYQS